LSGAYWAHPRRLLGGLYRCAEFGLNRCSTFDNILCVWLENAYSRPKKWVLGGFDF